MSLIEGGGKLVDYANDFSTTDPLEWDKHCREVGMKVSGEMPCVGCKIQVKLEGHTYGKPVLCESCKEELL